jgi:hypothetical protein
MALARQVEPRCEDCAWITLAAVAVPAAAAIIGGTVSEHRSGQVRARARVAVESASGSASGVAQPVFADSTGQFRFTDLPAGAYLLRAEFRGFAAARFGGRPSTHFGTPIVLDAGGSFAAGLRLKKLGVVTGEVRDDNRVGLAPFEAGAYRAGSPPRFAASNHTGDRGCTASRDWNPEPLSVARRAHSRTSKGFWPPTSARFRGPRNPNPSLPRWTRKPPASTSNPSRGVCARRAAPFCSRNWPRAAMIRGRNRSIRSTRFPLFSTWNWDAAGRYSCPGAIRREDSSRRLLRGEGATLSPGRGEIAASTPPALYVASHGNARSGENGYEFSLHPAEEPELSVVLRPQPATLADRVWSGPVRTTEQLLAGGCSELGLAGGAGQNSGFGGRRGSGCDDPAEGSPKVETVTPD